MELMITPDSLFDPTVKEFAGLMRLVYEGIAYPISSRFVLIVVPALALGSLCLVQVYAVLFWILAEGVT